MVNDLDDGSELASTGAIIQKDDAAEFDEPGFTSQLGANPQNQFSTHTATERPLLHRTCCLGCGVGRRRRRRRRLLSSGLVVPLLLA